MNNDTATFEFNTVQQYCEFNGVPVRHPLVAVVDYKELRHLRSYVAKWGLYAIFLKDTKSCIIKYGKTEYDYDDMSIVALAPGQSVSVEIPDGASTPKGTAVVFHPDFLFRTPLAREIRKYSFFSYQSSEALHLSVDERQTIVDTMEHIRKEVEHPIDNFSKRLIISNLELLLDYCQRYYSRQFTVREVINYGIMAKFETLLDKYLSEGTAAANGIPSVKFFADKVSLSPSYFGDLVKRETGVTAQDYIHSRILTQAKEWLVQGDRNVSQVAYSLGFQYPQHFIRFFKRKEGITPREFANLN